MAMLERWKQAWRQLEAGEGCEALHARLLAAYAEPHRSYHTLAHLEECFAQLDLLDDLAERPAELAIALWFHDAVYAPARKDNEARSAAWARTELLARGVCADAAERVHALILATRHGSLAPAGDASLLVDADLAILAAPRARFDEYEGQIRAEYAFAPEPVYRDGRRKILKEFANRPHIYSTERFRESCEAKARENLSRALARLGETAPG
jgi:predicted metal-dependent HD superfamily phosphohydrolase